MTREEFKNIVKAIKGAYTQCPITTQEIFNEWYSFLSDLDYAAVSKNLQQHIKTNKFSPTIAELRKSKSDKFNNFLPRGYDMDKLENALLAVEMRGYEDKYKIEVK